MENEISFEVRVEGFDMPDSTKTLCCPTCNSPEAMQYKEVNTYLRKPQNGVWIHTRVEGNTVTTDNNMKHNPGWIDDAVGITFECGMCGEVSTLGLWGHNGRTHLIIQSKARKP